MWYNKYKDTRKIRKSKQRGIFVVLGGKNEYVNSLKKDNINCNCAVGYTGSSNGDVAADTATRTGTKFVIAKFDENGVKKWMEVKDRIRI